MTPLKYHSFWLISLALLSSCARQSSPMGGPKDTIPPILIQSVPANESVNFKANQLDLIFSEDVILNAPKEQLIVTPTIGKDYKITSRRNLVRIEFEDPLLDSTTYTFNFRETVQDITEKNPVRNLQLAYSTGTYLDSLSIEGTISEALKGIPVKEATVALHIENDTFNIFEHPATYFTKTDDKGKFKISHLKPDNYFLYAFEDKNRNLIVNSRSEAYGFLRGYQYLLDNIQNKTVSLIRLDAGPLTITSARAYNTYFNIRTSKNLSTFTLTATDSIDFSSSFGEDQANIKIYKITELDSIQVHLLALDSIGNTIDTTLYAKFLTREVTPEQFQTKLISSSILAHTGALEATLQFSKPILEINFDSLYFKADSLTQVPITTHDVTWDPLTRTILIKKNLDQKLFPNGQTDRRGARTTSLPETATLRKGTTINELHFGKGAFISVENDSSDGIIQAIKPATEQELSTINIEIRTNEPSFLVELLDPTFKVVRQVQNSNQVRFSNVTPGNYQIRLVIDINKNGRWDPGNYFSETEAEPIIYYKAADGTTIIKGVKANWEIGTEGEMFITY